MDNLELKTFNPLNVSSKFAICGLPIRVDSYKTCSFGCKYCFSNNRKVMEFKNEIQVANLKLFDYKLNKVFVKNKIKEQDLLENLLKNRVTLHWGGMSDPFQPCEKDLKITKQMIDIANKYNLSALFSTKGDTVYGANINPELHSFQLSVTNINNLKKLEPNVPDIEKRIKFFKELKKEGFKVGIRIQPFIPDISTLEIVKAFEGADHFTLEGIKIVPQNKEHKEFILNELNLKKEDFKQMGLLTLQPEIRLDMYKDFIEYFEKNNISYSIADNDLRYIGNNKCCCGDALIKKDTNFNTTSMIKTYGKDYKIENIYKEMGEFSDCKCNQLFTSNRREGCITMKDFYDKRFERRTSPFSPKYQYIIE